MDRHPPPVWNLRSNLEFSPRQHQSKSFVLVKDPVTARYFRFTESQSVILELLREPVDAETLSAQVSERLGGSIPVATIEAFLKSLEDKWLLDTTGVREKLATVESHKLKDRNLLYWKLVSINPERIFEWLLPRTGWAFTRAFHIFAAFSILTGFVISYLHWSDFRAGA